MRNLLVVFASTAIVVSLTMPSFAQAYLYGLPSDGVSSGPYGNADYNRYRYNDPRASGDWRDQRNDRRTNNNEGVWRRDRNDWQKADDWRPRNPREDDAAKNGEKYDAKDGEKSNAKNNAKNNADDDDCRRVRPWRRESSTRRCP